MHALSHWFSAGAILLPGGHLAMSRGNFWLPQLEMGLFLAPNRHKLAVLGNILQSTGPTVKNDLVQNVSSAKVQEWL